MTDQKIITSELSRVDDCRAVHIVTKEGSLTSGVRKDGSPNVVHYPAGSFVLSEEGKGLITGPTEIEGALQLARAVVSGHARVLTDPSVLLVLAMSLIASASMWPAPAEAKQTAA